MAFKAALEAPDNTRWPRAERAAVMGEVGLCQFEQRKYRDAAEHLAVSLDAYDELPIAFRKQVSDALSRAVKQVGRVYLTVTPSDAEVILDAQRIGLASEAYELFVEPGSHTIRAHLYGYEDALQVFDVAADGKHRTEMKLPRAPEPRIAAPVAVPQSKTVTSAKSAPLAVSTTPVAGSSTAGATLRYAGVAAAGLTAVAGGTFLIVAASTRSSVEARSEELLRQNWLIDTCRTPASLSECSELSDGLRRESMFTTLGVASFIASGTIGAVTLVSFVWARASSDTGKARAVSVVTKQQAGLSIHGVW